MFLNITLVIIGNYLDKIQKAQQSSCFLTPYLTKSYSLVSSESFLDFFFDGFSWGTSGKLSDKESVLSLA